MSCRERLCNAVGVLRRYNPVRQDRAITALGLSGARQSIRYMSLGAVLLLTLGLPLIAFAQFGDCTPAPPPDQPSDAVVLTMAVSDTGLVKTVKVEKEVFLCANGRIKKEVNIFTEKIENLFFDPPEERRITVATCFTNINAPLAASQCTSREMDLSAADAEAAVQAQALQGCTLGRIPGGGFAAATVAFQDVFKTVKVEKEKLVCGPFIVERNQFTEIIEVRNRPQTVVFELALCIKNMQGDVLICLFSGGPDITAAR
jgi:hypothetical protein